MGDQFGTSDKSHQYLEVQKEFNNLLVSPQMLLNSPPGRPNSDNEKQEPSKSCASPSLPKSTETGKGKDVGRTHSEYTELDIQRDPKTSLHDGANYGENVMQNLSNGDSSADKKSVQTACDSNVVDQLVLDSLESEKNLVSIHDMRSKFLYGDMDTRNLMDTNFYSVSSLEDIKKLQDLSTGKLKYEEPGNGDLVLFRNIIQVDKVGIFRNAVSVYSCLKVILRQPRWKSSDLSSTRAIASIVRLLIRMESLLIPANVEDNQVWNTLHVQNACLLIKERLSHVSLCNEMKAEISNVISTLLDTEFDGLSSDHLLHLVTNLLDTEGVGFRGTKTSSCT